MIVDNEFLNITLFFVCLFIMFFIDMMNMNGKTRDIMWVIDDIKVESGWKF